MSEQKHIIGKRCPKGHVNYYDKRQICTSDGEVFRSAEKEDRIVVKCKECGESFVITVDCEGYK